MAYKNSFHRQLETKLKKHGGLFNAHAHIDRFATADQIPYEGLTMIEKQSLTGRLHRTIYTTENLTKRMSLFLEESSKAKVKRIDSFVDVASDIKLDNGLGALNVALKLKEDYKDQIDFRVGAYPIFGFKESEPESWDLFIDAAKKADFIGTLPERDDEEFYKIGRGHIGFEEHFKRILLTAVELNKPAHFHIDQQNNPNEYGTETLIEAVKWSDKRKDIVEMGKEEPLVWAVHSISPSTYDEKRFERMLEGLLKYNIGVIVCPSAAISMRQLRVYQTPIFNSIANVLPMLEKGIPIRVGTDNVDDMFLPSTTLDPRDEITDLSNAIRFYNSSILAKIACGKKLDPDDQKLIREHLKMDKDILSDLMDSM